MTDADALTLTGFRDSVYTWSVRWALSELGVPCHYDEVNPFAGGAVPGHPFGLVPVLQQGDFALYETAAILGYLDRMQDEPRLFPPDPRAAARMAQVMSVAGTQVYWPLVRQVYSNGWYLPNEGQVGDGAAVRDGLTRARVVLGALEAVAQEGLVLTGDDLTLADLMLAPMLVCFARVPDGAAVLADYPALEGWLDRMRARPHLRESTPPCLKEENSHG